MRTSEKVLPEGHQTTAGQCLVQERLVHQRNVLLCFILLTSARVLSSATVNTELVGPEENLTQPPNVQHPSSTLQGSYETGMLKALLASNLGPEGIPGIILQ